MEYPGLSLVLSGNSRDKVNKKMKNTISSATSTKVYPNPPTPVWFFSGIAHSKVCLHHGAAHK